MDLIPAGDLAGRLQPVDGFDGDLGLSSGLYRLRFILPSVALAVTPF